MNNRKQTKRALLTSVMALVMCVVMLVGTTFAWFTDTASTSVNKIEAGKLDVDMVDANGDSLVGKTLSWQKADAGKSQEVLWEPGATYDLNEFRIVNKGSLALKYEITVNGVKGSSKLLEAIDFTAKINGSEVALNNLTGVLLPKGATVQAAGEVVEKTDLITISGTMKTSAGNEYQGLTIDGVSITVVATQYTYEYDSNGKTYDETADATIQVNKDNIQNYLDGKYGSIDGMTLVLAEGEYGQLELGRATKYAGSNTRYFILNGNNFNDPTEYSFSDYYALKNNGSNTYSPMYIRSMSNVTFKAADGAAVKVAGVYASSGHKYADNGISVTDYVLDRTITEGSSHYLVNQFNNITFEGITFTAKSDINTSIEKSVINGFAFKDCTFNINDTADGNQAIRYYNENNNGNVSNLVVDSCKFNRCYQGVYTNHVYGVTVNNCEFNTTGHNAIAIQDFAGVGNHGEVVITSNTFTNVGDRIIRFNNVGADTQITIKGNTATNSGDAAGEVIKATSLAAGIKYDISNNSWGENTKVVNAELADK